MTDGLLIGRVRTAFGLSGELKVESYSGETGHFTRLESVELLSGTGSKLFEVEAVRVSGRQVLLKLRGVDTPEQAAALRGWELVAERDRACPLGPGEYYYADLVGLSVFHASSEVGRVRAILEGGAAVFLEVELVSGQRRIIPFQDHFVGRIDLAERTIVVLDAEVLE